MMNVTTRPFGLLSYRTSNLGDFIQSVAARIRDAVAGRLL